MELGTFGAILKFAMALEQHAVDFYAAAASSELASAWSDRFESFAKRSRERLKRLELARRELVSEMILESIVGLDGENYQAGLITDADQSELLGQARELEQTSARFYRDAATKMPIREVVRLFRRMAEENEQRATLLAAD